MWYKKFIYSEISSYDSNKFLIIACVKVYELKKEETKVSLRPGVKQKRSKVFVETKDKIGPIFCNF